MKYRLITAVSIIALGVGSAAAQSHQPYAGMQKRSIKALSEEQQADLRAGRGMGFALAAELNGYPGPSHVLELADRLALSEQQRAEVKRLFDAMKSEATPLGEKLIAQESDLDRQFARGAITPDSLATVTAAIGATQGALRYSHLKYHLSTASVLSQDQMRKYAEVRGYTGSGDEQRRHGHH